MSDIAHFSVPYIPIVLTTGSPYRQEQFETFSASIPATVSIHWRYWPCHCGVCEDRNAGNNRGCSDAPDSVRQAYLYNLYGGSFTPGGRSWQHYRRPQHRRYVFLPCGQPWMSLYAKHCSRYYRWLTGSDACPVSGLQGSGANHQYCSHWQRVRSGQSGWRYYQIPLSWKNNSAPAKLSFQLQQHWLPNLSCRSRQHGHDEQTVFRRLPSGNVRDKIEEAEPIIRQADMMSFDITAIKHNDAPANQTHRPTGFMPKKPVRWCVMPAWTTN